MSRIRIRVKSLIAVALIAATAFGTVGSITAAEAGGKQAPQRAILRAIL